MNLECRGPSVQRIARLSTIDVDCSMQGYTRRLIDVYFYPEARVTLAGVVNEHH